jgi:uncharacterized protein (TIGR02246 family)
MTKILSALCVLAASTALAQPAPTPVDDQTATEVRALTDRFVEAWNSHDAKALAAMWSENGDYAEPDGRTVFGRADIEKLFALEHGSVFKKSELHLVVERVRSVSETVAVADGTYELFNATDPAGRAIGTRTGYFTNVLVKGRDGWQVSAGRLMLPATLIWRER